MTPQNLKELHAALIEKMDYQPGERQHALQEAADMVQALMDLQAEQSRNKYGEVFRLMKERLTLGPSIDLPKLRDEPLPQTSFQVFGHRNPSSYRTRTIK